MTKIGIVAGSADGDDRDSAAPAALPACLVFGVATGANRAGRSQGLRGPLPAAVHADVHRARRAGRAYRGAVLCALVDRPGATAFAAFPM